MSFEGVIPAVNPMSTSEAPCSFAIYVALALPLSHKIFIASAATPFPTDTVENGSGYMAAGFRGGR